MYIVEVHVSKGTTTAGENAYDSNSPLVLIITH